MGSVECPICGILFPRSVISAHADRCLDETDVDDDECVSDVSLSSDSKRLRVEQVTDETSSPVSARCISPTLCDLTHPPLNNKGTTVSVAPSTNCDNLRCSSARSLPLAKLCPSPNKSENPKRSSISANANQTLKRSTSTKSTKLPDFFAGCHKSFQAKSDGSSMPAALESSLESNIQHVKSFEECLQTKDAGGVADTLLHSASIMKEPKSAVAAVSHKSAVKSSAQSSTMSTYVPLAERMRPMALADFVGQGHVVGSQRPLRSLLESTSVVSMILWGPPGCGKVTVSFDVCIYLIFTHHLCGQSETEKSHVISVLQVAVLFFILFFLVTCLLCCMICTELCHVMLLNVC